MVTRLVRTRRSACAGFNLAELMISTTIFSMISGALLMSFISLKKNYVATTDFAINHADQMRISDYLALDFRRAVKIDPAPTATQPISNDAQIFIPIYYDATGASLLPALDGAGGIFYTPSNLSGKTVRSGAGVPPATFGRDGEYYVDQNAFNVYGPKTSGAWGSPTALTVRVHYYLQGSTLYRQEGDVPAVALANDVQDFVFTTKDPYANPTTQTDAGKVIATKITFKPTFRTSAATIDVTATAFNNTTLLRNTHRVY
jgi:type II secretory pathway component PulJ